MVKQQSHFYGNIMYDNKIDNYHYIGTQKFNEEVAHLYTGEKYGYTISKIMINEIIKSDLEKIIKVYD